MKYYIATSTQELARSVREKFQHTDHTCVATWIDASPYPCPAEMKPEAALACERDVRAADVILLVSQPDGERTPGGKFFEQGLAFALGKPIHIIGKPENVFGYHPKMIRHETVEDFITHAGYHYGYPYGYPGSGEAAQGLRTFDCYEEIEAAMNSGQPMSVEEFIAWSQQQMAKLKDKS